MKISLCSLLLLEIVRYIWELCGPFLQVDRSFVGCVCIGVTKGFAVSPFVPVILSSFWLPRFGLARERLSRERIYRDSY